jgi:hypothetical protein
MSLERLRAWPIRNLTAVHGDKAEGPTARNSAPSLSRRTGAHMRSTPRGRLRTTPDSTYLGVTVLGNCACALHTYSRFDSHTLLPGTHTLCRYHVDKVTRFCYSGGVAFIIWRALSPVYVSVSGRDTCHAPSRAICLWLPLTALPPRRRSLTGRLSQALQAEPWSYKRLRAWYPPLALSAYGRATGRGARPLAAAARPLSGRRQQTTTAPANHGRVRRDGGLSGRSAEAIPPPAMGKHVANAGRANAGIGLAAT